MQTANDKGYDDDFNFNIKVYDPSESDTQRGGCLSNIIFRF